MTDPLKVTRGFDLNGGKVENSADATNPQDLVTLAQLGAVESTAEAALTDITSDDGSINPVTAGTVVDLAVTAARGGSAAALNAIVAARHDTAANWTSANPVLEEGEFGFEEDTGKLKMGDSSTAWNSLAYFAGTGAVSSVFGRSGAVVAVSGDYDTSKVPDSLNKRYVTDAELTVLANTSGMNSGDQTTVSGNAGSATVLQTSRSIDGQAFNGSADITVIAPGTHAATGKTTPVDADELPLVDSAASNVLKKLTWANLKATLKTYFDPIYIAAGGAVTSIKKTGSTALTGAVTLSEGSNVTLTQTGNDISIASTGGGSVSYATPAVALGSAAAAGAASTVIRSDSTIAAFDTTAPSTQAFGDAAAVGTAAFAARRDHKHAMPAVPIGSSALVYRYTVTGTDKASIDTGTDTADAGSNDWSNGDLLEVFIYSRTDETAVLSSINLNLNNDTSAIYDQQRVRGANVTASAGVSNAATKLQFATSAASAGASIFGTTDIKLPNYAGTVGNKNGELFTSAAVDTTGGLVDAWAIGYRSTSAITRLAITPATALKKFKVGTQLLIYKRLAS